MIPYYFSVSGLTNFGASGETVPHGFFTSERTSTAGAGGGGGVADRVTVVVSVDTLTATDSAEAVAADDTWVVVVVSAVLQPGNTANVHSTPSAKKNFPMPIIPIAPFLNTSPPENEFYGRAFSVRTRYANHRNSSASLETVPLGFLILLRMSGSPALPGF